MRSPPRILVARAVVEAEITKLSKGSLALIVRAHVTAGWAHVVMRSHVELQSAQSSRLYHEMPQSSAQSFHGRRGENQTDCGSESIAAYCMAIAPATTRHAA